MTDTETKPHAEIEAQNGEKLDVTLPIEKNESRRTLEGIKSMFKIAGYPIIENNGHMHTDATAHNAFSIIHGLVGDNVEMLPAKAAVPPPASVRNEDKPTPAPKVQGK